MLSYQIIILAAGQGKRMKSDKNKQFLMLKGKPLIIHTLDIFYQDPYCQSIQLVVNPKEEADIQTLLKEYGYQERIAVVHGGAERQDSVFAGLAACTAEEGIILIHDGARPFVSLENVATLVNKAYEKGAALLAVPVTDTIKRVTESGVTTLDRKELWAAQTPQAFRYSVILHAHKQAKEEGYLGTDDASLVERLNQPVEIVQGSYDNMKLTTPEDVEKAHAILSKYD
ncbi:2-C-methyl-D-erythritol 4-phosphate cytidylyltransferase [Pontibacillus salicampi]|uniref:2-C-methyl-D-erythritol 4-phosphate cytidylyltransferase n=1 Tax=Pontibacillus salicampi TaxID=1449801 RepID=A0ABV6LTF0_9BACI